MLENAVIMLIRLKLERQISIMTQGGLAQPVRPRRGPMTGSGVIHPS
jgi:hypothetical protein